MDELKIFGCSASKEFAKEICDSLGMKLGESESFKFDNDNRFVKILETVRGDDVFVIQTSKPPVDENFMELLALKLPKTILWGLLHLLKQHSNLNFNLSLKSPK